MSEYWKSTPKYWCKFCKTYVRDTKVDKQQHDATPRHQGNIQRSLRTLHREHEREDRNKERAKAEVARLNGIVSGSAGSSNSKTTSVHPLVPNPGPPRQVSAEDRKKQLKQLVELGVEVPKEYRADFAMAGQWETNGERTIHGPLVRKEEDSKDALNIGVRKRRHEEVEEEREAGEGVIGKGWGSTIRRYPGEDQSVEDIGTLLSGKASATKLFESPGIISAIKKEESDRGNGININILPFIKSEETADAESTSAISAIVFKKRKSRTAGTM